MSKLEQGIHASNNELENEEKQILFPTKGRARVA